MQPSKPGLPGLRSDCVARIQSVNTRRAWIVYTVLRLLFFAVPFAVLYFIGWPWWLALVVATLASVSLSVIFLSKPRDAASTGIHEWRTKERTIDDIVEDEAVDEARGAGETEFAEDATAARDAESAAEITPEVSAAPAEAAEPAADAAATGTESADVAPAGTEPSVITEPAAEADSTHENR